MKAALIWLVVAVPLAWGVAKSVEKARPLFSSPAAAAAP
jgi:hypothetical protein